MSASVQLTPHSWATAHRVLLTVVAIAVALAVALTIAFVVSRTTTVEPITSGANPTPSEPSFPTERCIGSICAK